MNTARILIVEDEAVTAMAIRKHLTNLGYSDRVYLSQIRYLHC
jgi:CheY-like chemotaxis protein